MWGVTTGTWVLAGIVALYVGLGGLRSVAYVDTLQCVLLWFGIVAIGFITYDLVGGWDALNEGLAKVALVEGTKWGVTPGDGYSAYFAIPGVIQFTAGLGKETPVGGLWTGVMVLTYMFALMGIHSSPAFSMWAFSNKDPTTVCTTTSLGFFIWNRLCFILIYSSSRNGSALIRCGSSCECSRSKYIERTSRIDWNKVDKEILYHI